MKLRLTFLLFILLNNHLFGQDIFVGNWEIKNYKSEFAHFFEARLEIGNPEKGVLYPAQLHISIDSFHATYQLLLAKKNSRQLAVSTQKYVVSEVPIKLKNWIQLINGTFDFSKDLKARPTLKLDRTLLSERSAIKSKDLKNVENVSINTKNIFSILEKENLQFVKLNNDAWVEKASIGLLQPKKSPTYFGVIDTLFAKNKIGTIIFKSNKDNDIISAKNNNASIVDQIDSKKKRDEEEFILDTGLNIFVFFADDFGKKGFSSASINLNLESYSKSLNFSDSQNIASTFIAVKIYNPFDEVANREFQEYPQSEISITKYPQPNHSNIGLKDNDELNREGKVVGTLISKSQQLKFALWDDAIEDGDSISLSINGKWLVRGFPVKKKPQFLYVTLTPGDNIITFVADNLGSIVPNTTILEIIDGNKRKPFYIETNFKQNNLVKIFYKVN